MLTAYLSLSPNHRNVPLKIHRHCQTARPHGDVGHVFTWANIHQWEHSNVGARPMRAKPGYISAQADVWGVCSEGGRLDRQVPRLVHPHQPPGLRHGQQRGHWAGRGHQDTGAPRDRQHPQQIIVRDDRRTHTYLQLLLNTLFIALYWCAHYYK